jgi:predicted transposase/invertase (TIGR01784 family)
MLAENLENLVKKERQEGRQEGQLEAKQQTARNLIKLGVLSDEQIAEAIGLAVDDIAKLRIEDKH